MNDQTDQDILKNSLAKGMNYSNWWFFSGGKGHVYISPGINYVLRFHKLSLGPVVLLMSSHAGLRWNLVWLI